MITKNTKQFDIYVDNIFCFANKGIIQASTFIGAVVNENNNFNIKQWNINEYWELLPKLPLDDKTLLYTFKSFVIKSALCEMMMDFEKTLIKLYDILLVIVNSRDENQPYKIDEHLKNMQKFKDSNFENKLKSINKIIENKTKNIQLWKNLKYVRNCITHNGSMVDKGQIKLNIPIFSLSITDNVTKEKYIASQEEPTIKIGNIKGHGATIKISWDMRAKIFDVGEFITFTPAEIYYLIFALKESTDDLKNLFVKFLVDNRVEFGIKEENGIIKTQEEFDKQYSNKRELHISLMPKK